MAVQSREKSQFSARAYTSRKGACFVFFLFTIATIPVVMARKGAIAPIYVRTRPGPVTVCDLVQPETHRQLLGRFRNLLRPYRLVRSCLPAVSAVGSDRLARSGEQSSRADSDTCYTLHDEAGPDSSHSGSRPGG